MANTTKKNYTPDQRKKILSRIEELRKPTDGKKPTTLNRAVIQSGISMGSYRTWTGYKPKSTREAFERGSSACLGTIPLDDDSPLVVLIGKPSDINSALQNLSTIVRR